MRQRGHPSLACSDDRADCRRVEARRTGHDVVRRIGGGIDKWRCTAFRSQPIRAMAGLAILLINRLPGGRGWRRRRAAATAPGVIGGTHEVQDAGILVRDNVESASARLGGGAAKSEPPLLVGTCTVSV